MSLNAVLVCHRCDMEIVASRETHRSAARRLLRPGELPE